MNNNDRTPWRRSSLCSFDRSCVEVSLDNGEICVRDSKNPSQTHLRFTVSEWAAFIGGVFRGEFDLERLRTLQSPGDVGPGSPPAVIA